MEGGLADDAQPLAAEPTLGDVLFVFREAILNTPSLYAGVLLLVILTCLFTLKSWIEPSANEDGIRRARSPFCPTAGAKSRTAIGARR